jgi:putative transposase
LDAEENERNGVHTISTDEKTGIQALERIFPNRPMESGKVERIEYEYKRHGTTCLFGNWDVGRGGIVSPLLNPTRTEEDYTNNIERIVSTDPAAGWIFVSDNLNTHVSESLVLSVATMLGVGRESLGRKGKDGILKSMASRKAFLEDASHRIRFVYTPKHCSWLNQIEIWFSGLSRRVLRRGSFRSVEMLNAKILNYIEFYNRTAKPMKWKYRGLPNKIVNEPYL